MELNHLSRLEISQCIESFPAPLHLAHLVDNKVNNMVDTSTLLTSTLHTRSSYGSPIKGLAPTLVSVLIERPTVGFPHAIVNVGSGMPATRLTEVRRAGEPATILPSSHLPTNAVSRSE